MSSYFVLWIGDVDFDFGKKCNRLDYSDPNYIRFMHYGCGRSVCLGMVPHSKVDRIMRMED